MKAIIRQVFVEVVPDYEHEYQDEAWDPSEGEEVRLRLEQRQDDFFAGLWFYTGVRAYADLDFELDDKSRITGTRVTTPGLWGVESDVGVEYLEQIRAEELATLTEMLLALGLPQAEVVTAIGNAGKEG